MYMYCTCTFKAVLVMACELKQGPPGQNKVWVRVRVRVKLLRLFRVNNYGWRAAMEQLANLYI